MSRTPGAPRRLKSCNYAAKIYASETDIAAEDALGRMVETFMTMIMKPVEGEAVVIPEH